MLAKVCQVSRGWCKAIKVSSLPIHNVFQCHRLDDLTGAATRVQESSNDMTSAKRKWTRFPAILRVCNYLSLEILVGTAGPNLGTGCRKLTHAPSNYFDR